MYALVSRLSLLFAAVAGTAAGVGWHVAGAGQPLTRGVTDWWLMPVMAAVAYAGTGGWLTRRRPDLPIGWLLLTIGAGSAVYAACLEYGLAVLARDPSARPAGAAFWVANWLWVTVLLTIAAVLPQQLPDGRSLGGRWRGALALGGVAVAAQTLVWALTPYVSWSAALGHAGISNPVGVPAVTGAAVQVPLTVVTVGGVAAAFASLVARWRAAAGDERQQLKWILCGLLLSLVLYAAGFVFGPVSTALAMLPLPASCLVAAMRYRLWDVEIVVSRSLLYGGLVAVVLALYAGCVGLLGGLLGRTTGAPLIATAIVAVCVEPLHRRLRALINRLVYGDREDPFTVLARVGRRLAGARDGASVAAEVLPEVVASVATALRLPYVAVALADGETVEYGTAGPAVRETPLTYGGQQVGRLLVGQRPGESGRAGDRLLGDLARHAAVAAHTVVLARDLARSREELVAAREEERRRLYRELHDGVGPSLAALALQVETARDLAPTDSATAGAILDRVAPRLAAAVGDVREIVRGLRPTALDDLGLAGAVRELGGRFATPGLAITVSAHADGGLPAAVEVAAYRIVAEALTNAVRHAGARSVRVTVDQRPERLRLCVEDDGRGMPAQTSGGGLGVASMRERARELGGAVTMTPGGSGRGTRVEAVLPLGAS